MAISGTAGNVRVGGTAGTVLGSVTEWSADFSYSTTDPSGFGDTWAVKLPTGAISGSGSFSGARTVAGAMDTVLSGVILARTPIVLSLEENTTHFYNGTAYVTGFAPAQDYNGHATRSYTWESTGAWTITQT